MTLPHRITVRFPDDLLAQLRTYAAGRYGKDTPELSVIIREIVADRLRSVACLTKKNNKRDKEKKEGAIGGQKNQRNPSNNRKSPTP